MEELPDDIKTIQNRIETFRQKEHSFPLKPKSQLRIAMEAMFRMATEFVAPVLVALCIGYALDLFFDSKPICMLVLAVFGCAAGVLNIYKAAMQIDKDINKE